MLKIGSKYERLYRYLREQPRVELILPMGRLEAILGEPLPASARRDRGFWSNRRGGLQASAWLEAGFRVDQVDLGGEQVRFRRIGAISSRAQDRHSTWDGERVRALREHMGMNQADLAELVGVRQQTISEWEGDLYAPARGRAKHLDLVAERAEFPYRPRKTGVDKGSATV